MREKAVVHLFALYFTRENRPVYLFEIIQHCNCGALTGAPAGGILNIIGIGGGPRALGNYRI